MKSYILRVELSQDEDGRWNAVIPSLKGCYTWGNTRDEALMYVQDAAKCCIEDMFQHGEALPAEIETADEIVTAISL